jgi:signal transduction histidine kinase
MSRKLLVEHGGTIECESAAGTGTTFTVWLPQVGERPMAIDMARQAPACLP